ncbi:MAG: DUF4197 domain-containing protein [Alcanivorax sp.]|nr:DUF4197 domain-containing protein [Alcanivorax sp.]
MHHRALKPVMAALAALSLLVTAGCANLNEFLDGSGLGGEQPQLVAGIKQTLELSSTRAADTLSAPGGYANDPLLRITMPEQAQAVTSTLRQFGMGRYVDRVEALMNQGAEQAASEARDMFVSAVRNMTVTDALDIVRGDDTAATRYFRNQTESGLRQRYQPIIRSNLEQVGFYDQYRLMLDVYNTLPVRNRPNLDLEDYVLNQSLDGLFTRVASEEALIRQDPVGRGSQLIGSVFNR